MTTALLLATDNANNANNADFEIDLAEQPTQPLPQDARRITEHDADYQRLHSRTARALKASVRQMVRELRADPHDVTAAQSRFIQRHMDLLRRAYIAAHKEGQRDYYAPISNTPRKWVSDPPSALVQRRLTWYGLSSVLKMAHEAQRAVAAERHALSERAYTFASAGGSGGASPVDLYLAGVNVRADLQANIAWSGLQDGYVDGGASDSVGLYSLVWWMLEPLAAHCNQCPELAADSPYNAPGIGSHELPATPGDGYTDCGAGCKCSLEYRPPSVLQSIAMDRLQQALGLPRTEDIPGGGNASGNVPLVVPPNDGYTDNQRRALDLYRATAKAWAGWNDLGGGPRYPHFPPFAADSDAWEAWSNAVDWRTLPEKQRQLLWQLLEARLLWATPDGMEG